MSNSAYGVVLKDIEGNQIVPKTKTKCVYDENNNNLEEILKTLAKKIDIPTALPANGGNAETLGGLKVSATYQDDSHIPCVGNFPLEIGSWIDFHLAGNTTKDYDARLSIVSSNPGLVYTDERNTEHNMNITQEILDLKQSVADGKTSVANAINDKLGTKLSNQTPFADLANYITNNLRDKLAFKEDSGFSNGLSGQWFTFENTTAIMASIAVSGSTNANIAIQTSKKAKILLLGNGETSTFIEPNDTKYYYVYGNGQYNWTYGYYIVICEEPAEVKFMSSGSQLTVRPIV